MVECSSLATPKNTWLYKVDNYKHKWQKRCVVFYKNYSNKSIDWEGALVPKAPCYYHSIDLDSLSVWDCD